MFFLEETSCSKPTFLQDEVEAMPDIAEMKDDIKERINVVMNLSFDYATRFEQFAYLWEDDKKEYLRQFLKYGHQLSQDELDANSAGESVPDSAPTLDQFKQVVSHTYIGNSSIKKTCSWLLLALGLGLKNCNKFVWVD